MTDYSNLVTEIAAIPTISDGYFVDNSDENVELNLSIRKYCGTVSKKSNYLWRSGTGGGSLLETSGNIKFRSLSPDAKTLLIFRSCSAKEHFIEIWIAGGQQFVTSINVAAIHGELCTDEVFGSFSWSPSGEKFLYISEKKSNEGEEKDFKKFVEVSNFGERLQTTKEPVLCLLDVVNYKVEVLGVQCEGSCDCERDGAMRYPAQATFVNDDSLVFMGIDVGSKKLGMTYIYCRPTSIYLMNLSDKAATRLNDGQWSSRSPVVSKDGLQIAYLRNSLGRSHFKACQLIIYSLETKSEKVLVDIVSEPKTGFPGLFCQRIPSQRFTEKIYLNTCWFDLRPVISVNINDGKVSKLLPDFEGSLRILNIRGDLILIAAATPTNPGNVYIYNCRTEGKQQIQVTPIISNLTLEKIKESIEHRVLELNSKVHIVLLKPKFTEKKIPLIIIPHGGPNSVYSVDYVFYPVVFARLGFAVASINYTGSIGFGDSSIEELEGQIGVRDVEDCYLSLQLLLKSDKFDEGKVIVMGGSHGGYLTAHLSAKYPEIFCGAILRNPVIDLPSMTVTSDIADWTFGQLGIEVDQLKSRGISEEEMKLFLDRSPSKYAKNVKCPTLLMLGSLDLRVPQSQGLYWANLLKGNGVDCQVLVFSDANHGLETGESDRFGLEAILEFFKKLELM